MLKLIEEALSAHIAPDNVPGVVCALDWHGATDMKAIGCANTESPSPMHEDALFRIASLTKPITAIAAMILVEERMISLDEPVDRLLPELADRRVLRTLESDLDDTLPVQRPITVEDLLTCRMGMGEIFATGEFPINAAMVERGVDVRASLTDATSGNAWISALSELPLIHQPGEAWMYDTSITALGLLIERAARMPLADFYGERIFAPLSMRDTAFHVPANKLHRLIPSYWKNAETGMLEEFDPGGSHSSFAQVPGFCCAAAGLVSSAADYLTFARAMLNRGRIGDVQLVSDDSYRQMTTDHITPEQKARSPFGPRFWETTGWGYGIAIRTAQTPEDPNGFGWDGGYGTTCCWNHQTNSIGLLFSQRLMDSQEAPPHFKAFWLAAAPAFASS